MNDNKILLTGLWLNESKKGDKYFSGNLTYSSKVLILKNNNKKTEKAPDYLMYLVPKEDRRKGGSKPQSNEPANNGQDDIPF